MSFSRYTVYSLGMERYKYLWSVFVHLIQPLCCPVEYLMIKDMGVGCSMNETSIEDLRLYELLVRTSNTMSFLCLYARSSQCPRHGRRWTRPLSVAFLQVKKQRTYSVFVVLQAHIFSVIFYASDVVYDQGSDSGTYSCSFFVRAASFQDCDSNDGHHGSNGC